MKRDIGKAVYTIELQGAGKALQDLYSLDRAAQKVGKSFQSAMGGGRFNKTGGGGGGSRPSPGGGNVVERMLASRLPGQGMVNVPGLINDKQIKAIEKALADTSRTFSTKQKEVLERALVMLKSSKDVTGATIEFANSYIRGFDDARNKSRENLQQLRAAFTAMTAVDPGFGGTGAGKQMQRDISLAELQIAREQNQLRLSRITGGFDRDVVAAGMQNAREAESGVMSNMRLAAMKPFTDGLNQALATGKNISAMLTDFQVAERRTGDAVNYVNRLYIDRVDALRRIRMFGEQALRAEEQRRVSTGEKPLAPEEAVKFQAEAEVKEATSMVPLIQQQKQYQNQLENVSAALIRVREEQARIAAAGGSESELRSLEVAEASLEKQANDLRQLNTLYDQLNDAVIQLANAQRAAAANPGSKQLARDAKEAEGAYLDLRHQVNELRFAINNVDNDLRTSAKGAKNAGFAMIQASYGAQDFIQVLAGGGGLQYALLASANNMSQVIVASQSLSKSLGAVGVPLLAFGVTAGMLALSAWMGKTKSEAERLEDAINGVNRSFGYMEKFARSIASLNTINPMTQGSISGAFGLSQGRAEGLAGESIRPRQFESTLANIRAESIRNNESFLQFTKDLLHLVVADVDPAFRRTKELEGIASSSVAAAKRGDVQALELQLAQLENQPTYLTDAEKQKVTEALRGMIDAINESKIASNEYAERMFQATKNIPTIGMSGAITSFDEIGANAEATWNTLEEQIQAEMKLANPDAAKLAKLRNAQAMIPEIAEFEQIQAIRSERGAPTQRMMLESLDDYSERVESELEDRIKQLQERRDATEDPEIQAELDAAIERNRRQQADIPMDIMKQKSFYMDSLRNAAQGDQLGNQLLELDRSRSEQMREAERDLEGPELAQAKADIMAASERDRLKAIQSERGAPVQRMQFESLDDYFSRADKELSERIANLQTQAATAMNPQETAEFQAAIQRARQQQADLAANIPQQQANMQARAFFAAQGDVLGQQMQGITEETQAAIEAAKRDLSGAQLATVLADIASADTRKRTIAQRQFAFGQESAMAGFQGQVLGAMGTPEARMAQEDLNLVGQFRDIQAMLDSGALGTGPGALAMAQDMLDMATAVSEQRKKDIEFENKKAGFSDIGSLWKQIQMSLKPDKSTQLQQQSVNILTAIQNRLAQGLSLTIP